MQKAPSQELFAFITIHQRFLRYYCPNDLSSIIFDTFTPL
jgi:hypothetical protein